MSIYASLGVPTVINGHETMTELGGSRMPAEVLVAMAEASKNFVDMYILNQRVGEEIAKMTLNEAAFVCGGAAAGLAVTAAACIVGDDKARIEKLPDTSGLKNEIIMHRSQRSRLDQAIRQVGANLVEVGFFSKTYPYQLEEAITPRTAAIMYFCGDLFEKNAVPLEQVIEIGERANVPVIVNAASQLPPVENLWRYTEMGAQLVVFSGGKGLRGPQTTGLIVGEADYVAKCALNSSPYNSIGRPMKTSKEDIIGLYTAIRRFVNLDHQAELQKREEMIEVIVAALKEVPGVCARRQFPAQLGQQYPIAVLTLAPEMSLCKAEVLTALKMGEPRIELGEYAQDDRSIVVASINLTLEEAELVAARLRQVLMGEPA